MTTLRVASLDGAPTPAGADDGDGSDLNATPPAGDDESADGEGHPTPPVRGQCGLVLTGTTGADTLHGTSGRNTIRGLAGDDTLQGFAGNDCLFGGDGSDLLDGGAGADLLHGGSGNDVLRGGGSEDSLYGDSGNDRLYGGADDDRLFGGPGNPHHGRRLLQRQRHQAIVVDVPTLVHAVDGGTGGAEPLSDLIVAVVNGRRSAGRAPHVDSPRCQSCRFGREASPTSRRRSRCPSAQCTTPRRATEPSRPTNR